MQVLRRGPERIVHRTIIRPVFGRSAPDHPAAEAQFCRAFELFDCSRNILKRDQRNGIESLGIVRPEFRHPVVIDPKTGPLEFGVRKLKQGQTQRGVDHLSPDPVDILVLNALDRVPTAGPSRFITTGEMFLEFLATPARRKSTRHRKRRNTGSHKKMSGFFLVFNDPRGAVPKPLIQSGGPQVGRLCHMRIGRNNT